MRPETSTLALLAAAINYDTIFPLWAGEEKHETRFGTNPTPNDFTPCSTGINSKITANLRNIQLRHPFISL